MSAARVLTIAGLGMTPMGRDYRPISELAVEAVHLALTDAGLRVNDVDGLLTTSGISDRLTMDLAADLQLGDLALAAEVNAFGASAGVMTMMACGAIASRAADVVVAVFADAPLQPGTRAGESYRPTRPTSGVAGLRSASGLQSTTSMYALAAHRHMQRFGTTSEQLGAVAVAQRKWAGGNPAAQVSTPLSLEQHQASRVIADPLRLLDCCLVSNGAVAVVFTSASRAQYLRRQPVYVLSVAQSHPAVTMDRDSDFGLITGAATSGPKALAAAGLKASDVTVAEIYDCYTYTALVTLEDYGFCDKGDGGPFVASGATAPGGQLPVNTGGGQLSGYYMWGMTPLSEGVIQARGAGGERQVPNNDVVLVSGNGGLLQYHSTTILSPHPKV